jgi:hypothetical protein
MNIANKPRAREKIPKLFPYSVAGSRQLRQLYIPHKHPKQLMIPYNTTLHNCISQLHHTTDLDYSNPSYHYHHH